MFKSCKHEWQRAWMHAAELLDNEQLRDLDVSPVGRLWVVENGRQVYICRKCGDKLLGQVLSTFHP